MFRFCWVDISALLYCPQYSLWFTAFGVKLGLGFIGFKDLTSGFRAKLRSGD